MPQSIPPKTASYVTAGHEVNLPNSTVSSWKAPVRFATTSTLPAYTASGNTLTSSVPGAALVVGTENASVGDRILVSNDGAHNGIYTVNAIATSPSTSWSITRSSDANTWASLNGAYVNVTYGDLGNTIWSFNIVEGGTLNVTGISVYQQGIPSQGQPVGSSPDHNAVLYVDNNGDLATWAAQFGFDQTNGVTIDHLASNINANGHSITGLADPTSAQDAATKNYVDTGGPLVKIAAITVGSPTNTITFSSIPSTYSALRVQLYLASNYSGGVTDTAAYTLNGDTGSNYDIQYSSFIGASQSSGDSHARTDIGELTLSTPSSRSGTPFFSTTVIDLPFYGSTAGYKVGSSVNSGIYGNGSGQFQGSTVLFQYRSSSVISSFTATCQNGQFITGCQAILWGYR